MQPDEIKIVQLSLENAIRMRLSVEVIPRDIVGRYRIGECVLYLIQSFNMAHVFESKTTDSF